jgi:hypothetical protein
MSDIKNRRTEEKPSELALYRVPGGYPHRKRVSVEGTLLRLHKKYTKAMALGTRVAYHTSVYEQERVLTAMRSEYVICDASEEDKNLIGGCGADPSILVFIRRPPQSHPKTGKPVPARAAVVHLNVGTELKHLEAVLQKMPSTAPLQVTLVSGGFDALVTQRLFDIFSPGGAIVKIDMGHGVKDAILDIRTGLLMNATTLLEEGRKVHFQGTPLGQPVRDTTLRLAYDNTFAENDFTLPAPSRLLAS